MSIQTVVNFSFVVQGKPRSTKIDLNDAFGLLSDIGRSAETSPTPVVEQLIVLRDNFMRAAYASNRSHRKNGKHAAAISATTPPKEINNG